jgi:hypothetical protein
LPQAVRHREHGLIIINDNAPLSERKLAACLDDDLTTTEWLRMLNSRVFFFATPGPVRALTGAALNRGRAKKILLIDTCPFAEAYGEAMEIVPINSGNTNYNAVRRGLSTFSPLLPTDYARWRRQRGKKAPDTIKEVAVRGCIPDIARFVRDIREGDTL